MLEDPPDPGPRGLRSRIDWHNWLIPGLAVLLLVGVNVVLWMHPGSASPAPLASATVTAAPTAYSGTVGALSNAGLPLTVSPPQEGSYVFHPADGTPDITETVTVSGSSITQNLSAGQNAGGSESGTWDSAGYHLHALSGSDPASQLSCTAPGDPVEYPAVIQAGGSQRLQLTCTLGVGQLSSLATLTLTLQVRGTQNILLAGERHTAVVLKETVAITDIQDSLDQTQTETSYFDPTLGIVVGIAGSSDSFDAPGWIIRLPQGV